MQNIRPAGVLGAMFPYPSGMTSSIGRLNLQLKETFNAQNLPLQKKLNKNYRLTPFGKLTDSSDNSRGEDDRVWPVPVVEGLVAGYSDPLAGSIGHHLRTKDNNSQ